jgi:hypothetical protein
MILIAFSTQVQKVSVAAMSAMMAFIKTPTVTVLSVVNMAAFLVQGHQSAIFATKVSPRQQTQSQHSQSALIAIKEPQTTYPQLALTTIRIVRIVK